MANLEHVRPEELSIVSAIETLSTIADLELHEFPYETFSENSSQGYDNQSDIDIAHKILHEVPLISKTVRWLHKKNAERILNIVRANFRTVLTYLQQFYHTEEGRFIRRESVEGIKTIMVLVSEAAENLDRYTKLFLGSAIGSVKDSKEFIDICAFYKRKIAPIASQNDIASWVNAIPITRILHKSDHLTEIAHKEHELALKHQFVDLDGVKKDTDYELFFLKRPDGSRYFTSRLIRNMKLVSRVEEAFKDASEEQIDISFDIHELEFSYHNSFVHQTFCKTASSIHHFFEKAGISPKNPLVRMCYSVCIALMFSRIAFERYESSENEAVLGKFPREYIDDIKKMIARLLDSDEYKRLLAYPSKGNEYWEHKLLECLHSLTVSIVQGIQVPKAWMDKVHMILSYGMSYALQEVQYLEEGFIKTMSLAYVALHKAADDHGKEQIHRLLEQIERGHTGNFDPLLYHDIPTWLYDIEVSGSKVHTIRFPSPTRQESVDSASVSSIFKDALRGKKSQIDQYGKETIKPWLLVNLQERTNWKDGARTRAIEEIELLEDFSDAIHVITIPRDGDFYWQRGVFSDRAKAIEFIDDLLDHMTGTLRDTCSVYWSLHAMMPGREEYAHFATTIHEVIFSGKNVLTRFERHNFIEYMHCLAILYALADIKPSHLLVTSKDGLDTSVSFLSELYLFIEAIKGREISKDETDWMIAWLHGFELMERGRILLPERHTRIISFAKSLQEHFYDDSEIRATFVSRMKSDDLSVLHSAFTGIDSPNISAVRAPLKLQEDQIYFPRRYSI